MESQTNQDSRFTQRTINMICPLCNNPNTQQRELSTQFYNCLNCSTVFRSAEFFLTSEKERERYLLHENDVEDKGYQQFVSPVVREVQQSFTPNSLGLDYGAGTGPVAAKLLEENGYQLNLWDPFFHKNESVLHTTYDYIICCEVIEHFYYPREEFTKLKDLLSPTGKLFCMTELLPKKTPFENWHYKNDKTHVLFYSEESLRYVQREFGFSALKVDGRLAVFSL